MSIELVRPDEDLAPLIERALSGLLQALLDHEKHAGIQQPKRPFTPRPSKIHDLIDDPVGVSLRDSIRQMGRELHALGGVQQMQDSLYAVSEAGCAQGGRWRSVMDHSWNMVGEGSPGGVWLT